MTTPQHCYSHVTYLSSIAVLIQNDQFALHTEYKVYFLLELLLCQPCGHHENTPISLIPHMNVSYNANKNVYKKHKKIHSMSVHPLPSYSMYVMNCPNMDSQLCLVFLLAFHITSVVWNPTKLSQLSHPGYVA